MNQQEKLILIGLVAMALAIESVSGVITVQIGGANRLTSVSRSRDRYNCYWDCDLVSCQIDLDDDECAYKCEKVCRIRYDYATVGRSGGSQAAASSDLQPKSGAAAPAITADEGKEADLVPLEMLGGELTSELLASKWRRRRRRPPPPLPLRLISINLNMSHWQAPRAMPHAHCPHER